MTTISMEAGLAHRPLDERWADLVGIAREEIRDGEERPQHMTGGAHTAEYILNNYPPEQSAELLDYGNAIILGKLEHVLEVLPDTRKQIARDGGKALLAAWIGDPQRTDRLAPRHLIGLANNWDKGNGIADAVDRAIEGLQPSSRLACNALTFAINEHRKEAGRPKPEEGTEDYRRPRLDFRGHNLIEGYDAEPAITSSFFRGVVLATSKIIKTANDRRRSDGELPITEISAESLRENLYPRGLPAGVDEYPRTTHEGRFDHSTPEDEAPKLEVPRIIVIVLHLMMDSVEIADGRFEREVAAEEARIARLLPSERRFAA